MFLNPSTASQRPPRHERKRSTHLIGKRRALHLCEFRRPARFLRAATETAKPFHEILDLLACFGSRFGLGTFPHVNFSSRTGRSSRGSRLAALPGHEALAKCAFCFVLVVRATTQSQVMHGGRPTSGDRFDMVELQETACFAAATIQAYERAPTSVAFPDRTAG